MRYHILIVEDDLMVRALLASNLEYEGHVVSSATSGKEMFAILEKETFNLILLDLNLPDEDGLVLARRVRARSTIPIIVLTARTVKDHRLNALKIGVDDYLVKPYDPQELSLKIKNLLSRSKSGGTLSSNVGAMIHFGGWILNLPGRSLKKKTGKDLHLTPSEFNILAALAQVPDQVLSRAHLLDAVSKDDAEPSDRAIDIIISRLRKKIERNPQNPRFILTITGHGYKMAGNVRRKDE